MAHEIRWAALFVAVAVLASACGGSDAPAAAPSEAAAATTEEQATPDAPETATSAAEGSESEQAASLVSPSLEFLGDLVVEPRVGPDVATFETVGGSSSMGSDARIRVSPDAFASPVEVTHQSFAIDFAQFLGSPLWGRAYVVSTAQDLTPAAPVTIEIDRPATELRAMQLLDGRWRPVPVVDADGLARIDIPHFSEVVTLVAEAFAEERAASAARAERGQADAEFLSTCIYTVTGLFGGITDSDDPDVRSQTEFALDLAYSTCVNALIRRSAPPGRLVSTECVGEQIGGDVDLAGAISACLDADDVAASDSAETGSDTATGSGSVQGSATEGGDADEPTLDSASYSITLTDADLPGSPSDSSHLTSFTADADVGPDGAEIAVGFTVFTWLRGGEEAPPFEDQNCGATFSGTAFGQGPTGNPTTIELQVTEFAVDEFVGALCQDDDGALYLRDPGARGGTFTGQLNGLGLQGEYRLPGVWGLTVELTG